MGKQNLTLEKSPKGRREAGFNIREGGGGGGATCDQ